MAATSTPSGLSAPVPSDGRRPEAAASKREGDASWLYGFVILQFLCQLALLFPLFSGIRVVLRMAGFATSLLLLLFLPGPPLVRHPLRSVFAVVLAIVTLSFLHPDSSALLASCAHCAMFISIIAPVYWVARLQIDMRSVERLLLLLWLFYTASAILGVLQAYYPGRFQPNISTVIMEQGRYYVKALEIRLSNGQRIPRPMGLTDVPGGAAYAGLFAILMGVGILHRRGSFLLTRLVAIASMLAGMIVLYLCQVRSLVVMLAICLLTMLALFVITGWVHRFVTAAIVTSGVIIVGFGLAFSVGGKTVTERLSTLVAGDIGRVYYMNRGQFLEHTLEELLPRYPLGAGLARWGMMRHYFGDGSSPGIWAEIQWTSWLLDGGVPLMIMYPLAVFVAMWQSFKIAITRSDGSSSLWGAIIFSYSMGAFALTFNYPVYMSTTGLEFWLLNAVLYQANRRREGTQKA